MDGARIKRHSKDKQRNPAQDFLIFTSVDMQDVSDAIALWLPGQMSCPNSPKGTTAEWPQQKEKTFDGKWRSSWAERVSVYWLPQDYRAIHVEASEEEGRKDMGGRDAVEGPRKVVSEQRRLVVC